jgi:two-component system KDP operon response regulator KdpE
MTRILIIDDEPQIQRFLRISLSSQGYDVISAVDGAQGIAQVGLAAPDLIILDLGLPDMDGQRVLQQLRGFSQAPVIVLSVRASENDKVQALDAGASDYVVKPFGVNELLARIRRLLSDNASGTGTQIPRFDDGHLRIEPSEHRAWLQGNPIHLSRKEFMLLLELHKNAGRVVTQQQLLERIWGVSHKKDAHYLRIFIGKLRAKLSDNAAAPRYIETEPGVGYRFIGEVIRE